MKFNTWTLEPSKYLTGREAERLLRVARHRAEWAESLAGQIDPLNSSSQLGILLRTIKRLQFFGSVMWFNVHNSLHAILVSNDYYKHYRLFTQKRIN